MPDTARFDSLVRVTRHGRWLETALDASHVRLMAELDRGRVGRACLAGLAGTVDNAYVLECAKASDGRLLPIGGLNAAEVSGVTSSSVEVASLARSGFAGITLHPRLNAFDPLSHKCVQAIRAASQHGLVVFLDTLFRQRAHATSSAADVVDRLAHLCPGARMVLLHGGGPSLLELAEVVRVHESLVLDLSGSLMQYAGSSIDLDMRWLMQGFDQRVVIGSKMPEFTPAEVFARAEMLADGLTEDQWANISHRNLERLFAKSQI
jgi:predicted TIM-barrel fold metal-dependent hydrolase